VAFLRAAGEDSEAWLTAARAAVETLLEGG
jgi:hypothetical protein